jgi:hypothetical protein
MLSSYRPYTLAESVALTIRQSRAEIRRSRELLASTAHLVPHSQDPASAAADSPEPDPELQRGARVNAAL